MALCVKCVLCWHEDLSSDSKHPHKKSWHGSVCLLSYRVKGQRQEMFLELTSLLVFEPIN